MSFLASCNLKFMIKNKVLIKYPSFLIFMVINKIKDLLSQIVLFETKLLRLTTENIL
jgi:hypothetical protein